MKQVTIMAFVMEIPRRPALTGEYICATGWAAVVLNYRANDEISGKPYVWGKLPANIPCIGVKTEIWFGKFRNGRHPLEKYYQANKE